MKSLHGLRKNVFFTTLIRHRHHPLYEPLAVVAAALIILSSLYLYTSNWPPLVVIESDSMQHGSDDVLGVVNTGDIVLIKNVTSPSDVVTYVEGEVSGYSTYWEFGDVILYYPNGDRGETPVIHRALLWLDYNGGPGFRIPSILSLSCSLTTHEEYMLRTAQGSPYCLTNPWQRLSGTLLLYGVGYNSVTVSIDLDALAGNEPWSGFVTLGDNNNGEYDQFWEGARCDISCIVMSGWVVGAARGMIPWFGAPKLWLTGQTNCNSVQGQCIPVESWYYLGLSIALLLFLPQVIPLGIRKIRKVLRDHRTSNS